MPPQPLTSPQTVLAFKAGRAFRRGETNWVDASPEKGALCIDREDEMLRLLWKTRADGDLGEELILFPGDATFTRVTQADQGRVYVLKFSSSSARHFFYMQDTSSSRDEEFTEHVNALLQNPSYVPVWQERTSEDTRRRSIPQASSSPGTSAADLARLRELVSNVARSTGILSSTPDLALSDILTPANLTPLFTERPDLVPALFPHLPPDLPVSPSPEAIQQIIASPQFRTAVSSLDRAFRTGMLQGLMNQLGLPEEAGSSVEAFLYAIREQAQGGEGMETD
ncbi:proteasome complex subunit Rpn13 ubiquitin receptor-domain-containing protein [Vararia minispora EC-137]|uniref:Proteasome complex subunit Rpn13 ubiquitin receptor-domain-containing protein n=1 Tax=Vararia minispora EC-137 TaxID=1314806 RepID=A0ACB8QF90_9AGAM|nr:proteasome complex subunit Rpn13 ubiquitin receptor-domain-containing protein [Vararia minispora EC-137]